jgi:hypothetical protein
MSGEFMHPILLVNLETLERFELGDRRGLGQTVRIDQTTFHQVTPEVAVKIAAAVKRMQEAVEMGEEKQQVFERFQRDAKQVWHWAVERFGQERLHKAWEERNV